MSQTTKTHQEDLEKLLQQGRVLPPDLFRGQILNYSYDEDLSYSFRFRSDGTFTREIRNYEDRLQYFYVDGYFYFGNNNNSKTIITVHAVFKNRKCNRPEAIYGKTSTKVMEEVFSFDSKTGLIGCVPDQFKKNSDTTYQFIRPDCDARPRLRFEARRPVLLVRERGVKKHRIVMVLNSDFRVFNLVCLFMPLSPGSSFNNNRYITRLTGELEGNGCYEERKTFIG